MRRFRIEILLIFSLASSACFAEHNDRTQPMQIEADQVVMNEVQQISTFSGNVQVHQGTLQLLGDKIVITQDKLGNKVGKVYGAPASFRQKRDGLNEYVEGYGERIEYDTLKQTVDMYGQARLKRDQDFVRGAHINYNSQTEIFIVDNGAPFKDAPHQRVRAVLQPPVAQSSVEQP